MRVITRNEMAWDKYHEQYITTYQESYDFGHMDIDECKGGGAKGIIGLIGAIAIPFAAPAIASSLVASGTIAAASAKSYPNSSASKRGGSRCNSP